MPPFKNTAGLRNRYRVTNKSRLRIIKDTLDAENVVVDEDEERARVVSTAGVDAEDANVSLFPPSARRRRCCRRQCWGGNVAQCDWLPHFRSRADK